MQTDERTALQALVRLSIDTELEFVRHIKHSGPLLIVLTNARNDAIAAMQGLAQTDPANVEGVRKLQNEVQRFIDLLAYTKGIIQAGNEAEKELEPEQLDEIRRLVLEDDNGDDA